MKMLILSSMLAALMLGCGSKDKNEPGPGEPLYGAKPPAMKLVDAALAGDAGAIKQHIAAGTDLDQKDPNGTTPLIIAATFGHADVCKALAEGGANLDTQNKEGSTALMSAAFLCHPEAVKVLLAAGANKELKNNTGSTALDSVAAPWNEVKPIYDLLDSKLFKPKNKPIDYNRIQKTRPMIVEILKGN